MRSGYRPTLPMLAILLLLVPAGLGESISPNDAASGQDAGDTQDKALLLNGPGSYTGALGVNDPADWYRLDNENPVNVHCTVLDVTVDKRTRTTLEADGHRVSGDATKARPLHVSLASPFPATIDYGFEAVKTGPLDAGLREYAFTTDTLSIWELSSWGNEADGGPLPEDCAFGSLSSHDNVDSYTVDLVAGDRVVFSLADTGQRDIMITLIDPSGTVVKSVTDTLVDLMADVTGTWTVSLSAENGSTMYYLLGECHPMCFLDVDG